MKRMVSLSLAVCLLAASLPLPVYAEEPPAPTVDNQVTVEGTNDFGELLGDSLEEAQEEQAEEAVVGYGVTDLTFDGATATVSYETLESANLVVGVYTEDGSQLLASGSTVVQPEGGTAAVTIEGEMPTYFLAKAFLVDTYDFSPLSSEYATPLYTREMQELLASTADDYAADRVLTLGEDRTTNFAVYAEGTRRIQAAEGANLLTDNGNGTYTVANADESFTTLAVGDVFSYEYADGDLLIAKVAAVEVDGATVTITEDENVEMSDVFSQVKIEAQAGTDDLQYSPEGADPAVQYAGGARTLANDGEIGELKIPFTIEKEVKDVSGVSAKFSGSVALSMNFHFDFYITPQQFYTEFKDDIELGVEVEWEGQLEAALALGRFDVSPIPGVYIGFTPSLVVRTSGKMEVTGFYKVTYGLAFVSDVGFEDRSTTPEWDPEVKAQGSLFIGLDFKPHIVVISDGIISMEAKLEGGAQIQANLIGQDYSAAKCEKHECRRCLEGSVDVVLKIEPKIIFLDWLEYKVTALNQEGRLLDFYYSLDRDEFGWGYCPYRVMYMTLTTYGKYNQIEPGVQLELSGTSEVTNNNGVAAYWLRGGDYIVYATWPDGHQRAHTFTVSEPGNEAIPYYEPPAETKGVFGSLEIADITDRGSIKSSGQCGETAYWALYEDGTLIISGYGPMYDYGPIDFNDGRPAAPWVSEEVNYLIIENGITYIGEHAFSPSLLSRKFRPASITVPASVKEIGNDAFGGCEYTREIHLPEGLKKIGESAFSSCTSLQRIEIPDSVTEIGVGAFGYCDALSHVSLGEGITEISESMFIDSGLVSIDIPQSVTTIGESAFQWCPKLKEITIPEGVVSIGINAFASNTSLEYVELPSTLQEISHDMFVGCTSLKEVVLPSQLRKIGTESFSGCRSLSYIELPESLESIGSRAFSNCKALNNVVIPAGVTSLGFGAFSGCESLDTIAMQEQITYGNSMFANTGFTEFSITQNVPEAFLEGCKKLTHVEFTENVTEIADDAFADCTALEEITIPATVQTIGYSAFSGCSNLKHVCFEGSIRSIMSSAFRDVTANVYYPQDEPSWQQSWIKQDYGGTLTWIPYTLDENGNMVIMEQEQAQSAPAPAATALPEATPAPESTEAPAGTPAPETAGPESLLPPASPETARTAHAAPAPGADGETADPQGEGYDRILDEETVSLPSTLAAVGGEYGTTETGARTASFTGLRPGGSYVLLALASVETETPLSADNLLYITQGIADDSGSLQFTYRPRMEVDTSYVVACGPSTKDLADAEITLPAMYANGAEQTVRPTIVYDGETLTEGTDYVLVGQVSATDPGDYQCQVRGIYNYTGLVTIQYTVSDRPPEITSPTYEIADGCLYLPAATTAETLLTELTGADIRITSAGGEALAGKDPVGTGATLAQGEGEAELVVVLGGDIDGNGQIDTSDLLEMRRSLLEMIELEGAPLQAATVVSGADQPNTSDLLQLRRVLVGLADSMFPTPAPEPPAEGSAA